MRIENLRHLAIDLNNIPGVPGIGPKQATEFLQKYETLDGIYEHIDELSPGQQKKLTEGKKSAYLSQKLCTLILDAPIEFNLEDYLAYDIDYDKVQQQFDELEFRSLSKKLETLKKELTPPDEAQQTLF